MIAIDIPAMTYEDPGSWNGHSKRLIKVPAIHLELEHSLKSIENWEMKWNIPFYENQQMTVEQFQDYCRCMTLNKQKDPNVYKYLRTCDVNKIVSYMHSPMTARRLTKVRGSGGRAPRVQMTSEYYYYLMIQYGIPFDCAKWPFGHLIALIDCCQSNSGGGETFRSYREKQKYYDELNNLRRAKLGTKG